MSIVNSFSCLCLRLLAGDVILENIKLLWKRYLPSSVINEILGLIVIQYLSDNMADILTAG